MYNILFLTTRFPYPPDDGGKIDTLTNIKILSRNYGVFLFYIGNKDEKEKELEKHTSLQGLYSYTKDTKNNLIGKYINKIYVSWWYFINILVNKLYIFNFI